jgi:hypothetical protein
VPVRPSGIVLIGQSRHRPARLGLLDAGDSHSSTREQHVELNLEIEARCRCARRSGCNKLAIDSTARQCVDSVRLSYWGDLKSVQAPMPIDSPRPWGCCHTYLVTRVGEVLEILARSPEAMIPNPKYKPMLGLEPG